MKLLVVSNFKNWGHYWVLSPNSMVQKILALIIIFLSTKLGHIIRFKDNDF